jgi:outer membrane protein
MKRFFLLGAVCSAMLIAGAPVSLEAQARGAQPAATQATRFAFVNSQRILAEAPSAREAQQTFERDMQRFRIEVDSLEQALETSQADFQRQQATLSPTVRQQRQQEIQQQFITYQQRVQELEQTAQRRQAELIEPVMQRISEVIEQVRREGNYAMIFDASAGALITADPALDLTDRVISRLQTTAAR